MFHKKHATHPFCQVNLSNSYYLSCYVCYTMIKVLALNLCSSFYQHISTIPKKVRQNWKYNGLWSASLQALLYSNGLLLETAFHYLKKTKIK